MPDGLPEFPGQEGGAPANRQQLKETGTDMVFKKLLGAMGVGGPSVDTVLAENAVAPGGPLTGEVRVEGGRTDTEIERITLELVGRVEAEGGDEEREGSVGFARFTVGGGFRLAEGEQRSVPFRITLPWETPVTELHGQPLGVVLGVRTELEVAGAKDKGDLDPLRVRPLAVQEAVLEALGQLGFGFRTADLEYGHIGGTGQQLPFYQEIELTPPPQYAHAVSDLEVTFLAGPEGMQVVLEAGKRGGLFSGGHDAVEVFTVGHDAAGTTGLQAEVQRWIEQLTERHGAVHGGHGHTGGHHGGPGTGGMVAAGAAGLAAGVAGGMVAAEVVDEIGDAFEDEEEEEEEE